MKPKMAMVRKAARTLPVKKEANVGTDPEPEPAKNLPEYTKFLFDDLAAGEFSDCTFKLADEKVMGAHKCILAIASPVFKAMLFGALKEQNFPVEVKDIKSCTFGKLLEGIYQKSVELKSVEEACELYYAASKYEISSVVESAKTYLLENVSLENLDLCCSTADAFGEWSLVRRCYDTIQPMIKEIYKSPLFLTKSNVPWLSTPKTTVFADSEYASSKLDQVMTDIRADISKDPSFCQRVQKKLGLIQFFLHEMKLEIASLSPNESYELNAKWNEYPPDLSREVSINVKIQPWDAKEGFSSAFKFPEPSQTSKCFNFGEKSPNTPFHSLG